MKFHFYHPVHFENWDYNNSITTGIGGSETSQVEMAWRLARRGHEVICYAPIKKDTKPKWRGTTWKRIEDADFKEEGIWVIYRSPETLDNFEEDHPGQSLWLMMQDEFYPSWTEERGRKVDLVLALCTVHRKMTEKRNPYLKDKLVITQNGVKVDLIREIEKEKIKRNPKKLIYASSPDRGLHALLPIFKRAREIVPDLELHVFYGFNNINKLIKYDKKFSHFKKVKSSIEELLKQPGVFWRGRISQVELYKEWLSAGIWCYPTNFSETSCITSMEAMSMGAIPITNPYWALVDNIKHGVFIEGDAYDDPLTQARYVGEIIRISTEIGLQENIRSEMVEDARFRFNWERAVDQWEQWLGDYPGSAIAQFNFQIKHARGKILNLGCDIDPLNFGERGGTNVDLREISPIMNVPTKAHIIADVRKLPKLLFGRYNTVILGDILEHMSNKDIFKTLENAKLCLKDCIDCRRIIITFPEDYRTPEQQHVGRDVEEYAEGISSYHRIPLTKKRIEELFMKVGLEIKAVQEIDYTFGMGYGYVVS